MYSVALTLCLSAIPSSNTDSSFASNTLWDDGLAEVATYDASRVVYGKPRKHEAVVITVKEDLDASRQVKADPPYGDRTILPALKQRTVAVIPTDNYDYHFATSCFVSRNEPNRLIRVDASSQEWCGSTYKQLNVRDDGAALQWHSYFDGEADGSESLKVGDADLVRDALPLQLRSLPFAEGLRRNVRVFDLLTTSHYDQPTFRAATVQVASREPVETGLGTIDSWKVVVTSGDDTDSFWFGTEFPHILTKLEAADGRTLLLRHHERRAYWR